MSFYDKIRGTFETIFQIGKAGPQLKNNGGAIEVRNAVDAAFAIARGADPVGNDDLMTLRYFNAHNEGAAALEIVKLPLLHATKVSSIVIPDNSILSWAVLDVTTIYDGTTPTFTVKRTGDATVIPIDTGDSDLTALGTYQVPQVKSWGSTGTGTVTATFAGAGTTVGVSTLYLAYSTPIDIS